MSRLRRLVAIDRFFFISCRVLPRRGVLSESEFACLAQAIHERRAEHRFLLTAWVFLPDHWHAIFYPPYPLTISRVMEAIKDAATKRINRRRGEPGTLFQPRFSDRAVRTVREYHEEVEYIHFNPVKAGLVSRPEDWPWSSAHDYVGSVNPSADGLRLPPAAYRLTASPFRPAREHGFEAMPKWQNAKSKSRRRIRQPTDTPALPAPSQVSW